MGKQRQQVISRFFAPKPKPADPSSPSSSNPFSDSHPSASQPACPSPPPRTATTVSWSPQSKLTTTLPPPAKRPKTSTPAPTQAPPISIPSVNPSLHQRFVNKLLDDPYKKPEDETPPEAEGSGRKYTPLEQQVAVLKAKYPDVLLMVEVGYRYRFFGEDAEVAARILGIFVHRDHNFLTASIPTFRLNVHVRRLVNSGYKVGVVKQMETAAMKAHGDNRMGPFSRELSALYTKATLEAAEDMGGGPEVGNDCGTGNFLMCVVERDDLCSSSSLDTTVGVLVVEVSTGEVMFGEFNDGATRAGLEAVLLSISPAELLLGDPLSRQTEKLLLAYAGSASNIRVERTSRACLEVGGALKEIMESYKNMGDDGSHVVHGEKQGEITSAMEAVLSMPELPVQALTLVIRHLRQFGLQRILCTGATFQPLFSSIEMSLSSNTLQQLEVLRNNFDGSENGSLLHLVNNTLTAFGARLLKRWITHPLCDKNAISARLDAVSEIANSLRACGSSCGVTDFGETMSSNTSRQTGFGDLIASVLGALGRAPDVQRGITRILHRTVSAAEFIAVLLSLLSAGKQLQQVLLEDVNFDEQRAIKSSLLRRLISIASSSRVTGHAAKLLTVLNKDAADKGDMENLFIVSSGQFPEVNKGQTTVASCKHKLDASITQFRKQLGMRNLEFSSVAGSTHLLELPSNVRVPPNWVKVSSTMKLTRYHPPEVLAALDELALAKEELAVACKAAWDNFLAQFEDHCADFCAAVHALATLDCLYSLAALSHKRGYVRPIFVEENEPIQLHILSGRHPVLESTLQDCFVPNDTDLHEEREFCQIVTGPNMGGKSCYIRQVALVALMAQVGSFVPAASAKLHVLDAIYTRMGASDSIQHGSSTFFEELSQTSSILHNCTSRSLLIIDELGRGTSTHDGLAIAYATLHYILKKKKCMVLFVTHYPEIADIKRDLPISVGVYHMSYLTRIKSCEIVNLGRNQTEKHGNNGESEITFLYKLIPGLSGRSFGLNVASLAQLPSTCIAKASVMAKKLESVVQSKAGGTLSGGVSDVKFICHEENGVTGSDRTGHYKTCSLSRSSAMCFIDEFKDRSSEIGRLYRELFCHLQSALHYNAISYTNSLCCLRDAQRIAKQILFVQSQLSRHKSEGNCGQSCAS
ncbi:DNA mismatch repair protein MSH3 [Nymphaea colorata]|nr:DNA mismatch repair protein MSH3 [Nymphaea colorata]